MNKWFEKLLAWIDKWLDGKVEPAPNPTPTPAPTPAPTPIVSQEEADNGFSHKATIVTKIGFKSISSKGIFFSYEDRPWKPVDGCDCEAHIYYWRDGKWNGGKMDHARPNTEHRDFKHVRPETAYGWFKDHGCPKSGDKIAFCLVSYNHKERSNAIFAKYP